MESNVLKANEGLVERINALQAQVARLEKIRELCLETIDQFGHFVPSVIEIFRKELEKLDEGGAVKGYSNDD